jgi:hypothetical protein
VGARQTDLIDLRELVGRLPADGGHEIVTYERGKVVRRDHAALRRDVAAARAQLAAWGIARSGGECRTAHTANSRSTDPIDKLRTFTVWCAWMGASQAGRVYSRRSVSFALAGVVYPP